MALIASFIGPGALVLTRYLGGKWEKAQQARKDALAEIEEILTVKTSALARMEVELMLANQQLSDCKFSLLDCRQKVRALSGDVE